MLEHLIGIGTPATGIALATSKGNPIVNEQGPELDADALRSLERRRAAIAGWATVRRKPAAAVYNCAGMVWASRRTAIYDEADYRLILNDDGYRTLRAGEPAQLGDLAVYVLSGTERIAHVGVIVKFERPILLPGALPAGQGAVLADGDLVPYVLSKDNAGDEVIHHLRSYEAGIPCDVQLWTDRPRPEQRHA